MNIFEIPKVVDTRELDRQFDSIYHQQVFLQKQALYRAEQIRKDVDMLAGISVNGITIGAFYIVAGIIFQKIYDITGGTPLF